LASDNPHAEEIEENLRFFLPVHLHDELVVLPSFEADPYRGLSPHPDLAARRAAGLWKLCRGFNGILITPATSLLSRLLSPDDFLSRCIRLEADSFFPRDFLISSLRSMGYVREDPVGSVGEFSFRGGIVDIFSPSGQYPVRIEFFGDEIETIREFDPATQRSINRLAECEIVPMREMVIREPDIDRWNDVAPRYWNEVRFAESLEEKLQFTGNGELFHGYEFLFPLVVKPESCLFDYCSPKAVIVPDLGGHLESLEGWEEHLREAYEDCRLEGTLALPPEEIFFPTRWFRSKLAASPVYRYQELVSGENLVEKFDFIPERKYRNRIQEVLADVTSWMQEGESILFVMPTPGMVERVIEILGEYDVHAEKIEPGFPGNLTFRTAVTQGKISTGFYSPALKLHLLTRDNLFEDREKGFAKAQSPRTEKIGKFISDFRDLQEGDYVVHFEHGIGQFRGLKQIGVGGNSNEFVVVEYSGSARLYVPIDRLDLLQKYSSGSGERPHVDKLGGTSWQKTKKRIKKSMRVLAEDLLKLYAQREISKGYAFGPDDDLMHEFEQAFEFETTVDQKYAIEATKADMESDRPMDRLICGDVGYGKTEVAMRAAFKAVNDGKQVAVLAPTTVLTFQHFNTFRQRFSGFPVQIEHVSRFLSRRKQREVLEKAALGLVDILIGTHRLLSKDVSFKDLGLIIVDEEQRFGVAQKEKLKKLRSRVDVLTLSATPIPRTLNMSMVGIRDLSIIETPPKDRLAIQTALVRFSNHIIRSAIDLELKRRGQVFFVHNSVDTIYSMAEKIQSIVPEARVAVGHGQMREKLLEEVMLDYVNYRYDVLVCTTIIENGLDIPRANTILINHAERFGLSQLYQLRGRVGRSNRRAYAYLLIPGRGLLTSDARKRLTAIKDFSDLGSGFRLAALDLEIRGAGNLLGGEQSGHIAAVGFELYLKLLDQAIRELKGELPEEETHTSIELKLEIRVPEHYIEDSNTRLWLYKRISSVSDQKALEALESEIIDRFGRLPRSVSNLITYSKLRLQAQELAVSGIERKGNRIIYRFRDRTPVTPERLIELVRSSDNFSFTADGRLVDRLPEMTPAEILARVSDTMRELSVES